MQRLKNITDDGVFIITSFAFTGETVLALLLKVFFALLVIGLIDYGPEHNLIWVTAIDRTGEIWCAPNPKVRMLKNWTMGRAENPLVEASKGASTPGSICSDCEEAILRA